MKTYAYAVLITCTALFFFGCARQPTVEIRRSQTAIVKEANRNVLRTNIANKIENVKDKNLPSVNSFLDSLSEIDGTNRKIVVMVVEDKGFPPTLEDIFKSHPLLNTLPRDMKSLFVLESKRFPGVKNIFVEITAEQMGDTQVADWFPKDNGWLKYIDLRANRLEKVTASQAYFSLFWMGNDKWNPELIASVEGKDRPPAKQWDWSLMIHPKATKTKRMFIPLATMNGVLREFF